MYSYVSIYRFLCAIYRSHVLFIDLMNFSDLSLTQTKKVEMNTQVCLLARFHDLICIGRGR